LTRILSHSRVIIEWYIAPLRLILEEALPHLRMMANEREQPGEIGVLPDRRLTPSATANAAAALVSMGAMHQLAALVETCVHHLAGRLLGEDRPPLLMKRSPSWRTSLTTIEQECATRASLIEGWDAVSTVRKEVNASKHQAGFLFVGDPVPHFRVVNGTLGDPVRKLHDCEGWLVRITDLVDRHLASPPVKPSND
jgi:hypothetical protein